MRRGRLMEAAAVPVTGISATAFAALSALRRKRFFHPHGVVFEGSVAFEVAHPFPFEGTHRALVRMSRGIGTPEPAPDILGLAVKVVELGQDLLLVTSGENAVTRHLLIPATGFFHRPYSSVLPYELDGELIVFGARPASHATADASRLEELEKHVAAGEVRFELTWGRAGTSEVARFGSVVLERRIDEEIRFNPFNSHPALTPAGGLNRLRRDAYRSSQEARSDAPMPN